MRKVISYETAEAVRQLDWELGLSIDVKTFIAHCDALLKPLGKRPDLRNLIELENRDSLPFTTDDIGDWEGLKLNLVNRSNSLYDFIWQQLSENAKNVISGEADDSKQYHPNLNAKKAVAGCLSALLHGPCVQSLRLFPKTKLRKETKALLRRNPKGAKLIRLNRMLLEDAFFIELVCLEDRRAVLENLYCGLHHNLSVIELNLDAETEVHAELQKWFRKKAKRHTARGKTRPVYLNVKEAVEAGIMAGLRLLALHTYFEPPKGGRPLNKDIWVLAQEEEDHNPDPNRIARARAAIQKWKDNYRALFPKVKDPVPPVSEHNLWKDWYKHVKPNKRFLCKAPKTSTDGKKSK